jgi:magnesium transporter
MITKKPIDTKQAAEWLDILRPTKSDLDNLRKKFGIHKVIIEELKGPSARSKVEVYDSYLYLIYYFPVYDPKEESSRRTEIDFLITKKAVITVHYEELEAVNDLKIKSEKNSLMLTYKILEEFLNFQERQLRHIREKVEDICNELFKNMEKDVLQKVSRVKRDVSEYRIITRHQGVILKSLLRHGPKFWGEEGEIYLNDIVGDHLKIVNQIEDYRDAVSDFEDTNNQLMNLKTNEVMKTFTTLSFLTFPFMLLATIFNMNVGGLPLVNNPYGFWIIFVFMATAMAILAVYFKKKDWF